MAFGRGLLSDDWISRRCARHPSSPVKQDRAALASISVLIGFLVVTVVIVSHGMWTSLFNSTCWRVSTKYKFDSMQPKRVISKKLTMEFSKQYYTPIRQGSTFTLCMSSADASR